MKSTAFRLSLLALLLPAQAFAQGLGAGADAAARGGAGAISGTGGFDLQGLFVFVFVIIMITFAFNVLGLVFRAFRAEFRPQDIALAGGIVVLVVSAFGLHKDPGFVVLTTLGAWIVLSIGVDLVVTRRKRQGR